MNSMTKSAWLWALMTLTAGGFASCSDDDPSYSDVDGQNPKMTLAAEKIQTAAGRTINFRGTLEDADGIATINLQCEGLYLDKTIDLIEIYGEPKTSYNLDYAYNLKRDEIGERFVVAITVTDIGGRSEKRDVVVTLDGDFANPVFVVMPSAKTTVLMKSETKFNLNFSVSDDRKIDYVIVNIEGIEGYANKRIDVGQKEYKFSAQIILPNVIADYKAEMKVVDAAGNETKGECTISVSEMPDFPKMYLADVKTTEELNSDVFGVPMVIEHTGEFTYNAKYYCSKAGTEVFFLPQKSDFSPICFGLDPTDNKRLVDDPEVAQPIVLTEEGVYYNIDIDVKNSTYTMSTYSIAEATDPIPHEYGSINLDTWFDGGSWLQEFYFGYMTSNPREIMRFKQDAVNPHLFYTDEPISLVAGESMNFVIHNWHHDGWWNYCTWRVDDSKEPEKFGYYGDKINPEWKGSKWVGDNWASPKINKTGDYRLIFDAHLERAKMVPFN